MQRGDAGNKVPKVRANFFLSSQPAVRPLNLDRLMQGDGEQKSSPAALWHDSSSRRIGEASHPGPKTDGQDIDPMHLRIRTINVTSAVSNQTPILDQVADVIAIQEHCVDEAAAARFKAEAKLKGWQCHLDPTPSIRRTLLEWASYGRTKRHN